MSRKLVCARALDPHVVPGSVFHHRCENCGANVMVAPSGQRLLARHREKIGIICAQCVVLKMTPGDTLEVAPGAIEELLRRFQEGE